MSTKVKSVEGRGAVRESVTVEKSFPWLRPLPQAVALTAEVEQGLGYLQLLAGDDDVLAARSLVHFSFGLRTPEGSLFVRPPSISVLNRRRRAARLWINAVLAGDVSRECLRNLTTVWLPQLAGTGPDARRAARHGRTLVEFIRGTLTASVMESTQPNLLRHAKALHALDAVLAGHLLAIRSVVQPVRR